MLLSVSLPTTSTTASGEELDPPTKIKKVVGSGRKAGLFLSHEAMMGYLSEMYDKAEAGDAIWAQCVRCTNFNRDVRTKILEAAGKGVRFEMVIHQHSPALPEFETLFAPIKSAKVVAAPDNVLSLQGLSDKGVVIAFAGNVFSNPLKWRGLRFSSL